MPASCTFAHVTGGGLTSKPRPGPAENLHADVERSAWQIPAVFEALLTRGVSLGDAERTFNMGMDVCVDPRPARAALGCSMRAGCRPGRAGVRLPRSRGRFGRPGQGWLGGSVRLV